MKITDSAYGGGGGGGGGGVGGDMEDDLFGDPKSWPPGFRFHPTDEELVLYYLKRKMCKQRLKLDVVKETDVYKWDPEELPGQSVLKSRDRQWYFFTPRDRKYPYGARSNRATRQGYWKATGKDRSITWNSRSVGVKKTLVFYKGRAPSGERTDWVMHEYTMDEGELHRCKNVKDYYALYKVFKKSGPGPKNGEQYGAPFREEDWAEDGEVENNTPNEVTQLHQNGSASVDTNFKPPMDDLAELFKHISDESENVPLPNNEFGYDPPQVCCGEAIQNAIVGLSSGDVSLVPWFPHQSQYDVLRGAEESESITMGASRLESRSVEFHHNQPNIHEFHQNQPNTHGNFITAQPATFHMPLCDAPEVTSALGFPVWDSPNNEEVHFLELNDIKGPEQLGIMDTVGACDNFNIEGMNGWQESNDFFDVSMFLEDTGTINQNSVLEAYVDNVGGRFSSQVPSLTPSSLLDRNHVSGQVWMHDQPFHDSAPVESNQVAQIPTTGSSSNLGGERRNREGNENENIDSWFNSAVSALLDSIPTRPALASEDVLINRAFQRMSSFGRVRVVAPESGAAANGRLVAERKVSRNGGLLCLSVLGLICAVLWMLMIGTVLKVLKIFLARFTSS